MPRRRIEPQGGSCARSRWLLVWKEQSTKTANLLSD